MLSSAQCDDFDRRGLLRLPATIPPTEVTAMRQRLWQHLADTHGFHPDRLETWPVHWGRPVVTFPDSGTAWDVPTSGWHLDTQDLKLTMLVVFAHLAPVRPRGGGTLVMTGSHQLPTPAGPQAGTARVRSREVKAHLRTLHPWLRDLWQVDGDTDRIHRYLTAGADINGVHVRVEELTGEPGDAVIMHPRLLHVVAPNTLHTPRMMLLQFLHRRP